MHSKASIPWAMDQLVLCRWQSARKGSGFSSHLRTREQVYMPLPWQLVLFLLMLTAHVYLPAGVQCQQVMFGPCKDNSRVCNRTSVAADLYLGGLFPIHALAEYGNGTTGCGMLVDQTQQWVEAMRHAVDMVNSNTALLKNVTLGYEIRDTCRLSSHAVRQCLEFLGKSTDDVQCPAESESQSNSKLIPSVVGIVGPFSSSVSLATTELLGLFQLPMVSYGATSTQLSMSSSFPYFLRTIPSDRGTARAIARMIRTLDWEFVGLIHTADDFGVDGINAVKSALGFSRVCTEQMQAERVTQICQSKTWEIREGASHNDTVYEEIWSELLTDEPIKRSTVVVMFTQASETSQFFQYPKRSGNESLWKAALEHNITFIGVDAWGDTATAVDMAVGVSRGSISPIPLSSPYADFQSHWTSRTRSNTMDNPWFDEFWTRMLQRQSAMSANGSDGSRSDSEFSLATNYAMDSKVPYVYHSVFAFAHALDNLYNKPCNGSVSCLEVEARTNLLEALKSVSFTTINGNNFSFDDNGDPYISLYDIRNMQVSAVDNATISFPAVGNFSKALTGLRGNATCSSDNTSASNSSLDTCGSEFTLDEAAVIWNSEINTRPVSVCSETCPPGTRRVVRKIEGSTSCQTCCWMCDSCPENRISLMNNSDTCVPCENATKSSADHTYCVPVKVEQFSAPSAAAIVVVVLAVLAIIATLLGIAWTLKRYNDSFFAFGREPTLFCLFGMLLALTSTVLEVNGPSHNICVARFVLSAVGLTAVASFPLLFAIHRLCLAHNFQVGTIFIYPAIRFLGMLVAECITAAILIISITAGDAMSVIRTVTPHVKVELVCGYDGGEESQLVYDCLLNLVTLVLCIYLMWLAAHGKMEAVVYDPRSRLFALIAVASVLTVALGAAFTGVASVVTSPDTKSMLKHLSTIQFVVGYIILVLVPSLRKLGQLSREEEDEYVKALEDATGRHSRSLSVDIKAIAKRVRAISRSSGGGTSGDSAGQMPEIGEVDEDKQSLHSYKQALKTPLVEDGNVSRTMPIFFPLACAPEDGNARNDLDYNRLSIPRTPTPTSGPSEVSRSPQDNLAIESGTGGKTERPVISETAM
ncbi:metabotropic glutamate receptor 6-like [Sycon ciliatum]|uniref:metabotropic glutamate receptor 6-like n=1 Tax=Sycon ciliatum TaxID=27933 RepID=UPI0031F6964A